MVVVPPPSEDHSIRTRIETDDGCGVPVTQSNPQKIIPLEQGLKRRWYDSFAFPATNPQKIIPLEQGLKPIYATRLKPVLCPQKIIPLEQGLKLPVKGVQGDPLDPQKIIPLEQGLKRGQEVIVRQAL